MNYAQRKQEKRDQIDCAREQRKVYCEECETYITHFDSCECGTTMKDLEEMTANDAELNDFYCE